MCLLAAPPPALCPHCSPGTAPCKDTPTVSSPPETEWRRRMASKRGEEDEEEDEKSLRELQQRELSKVGE